MSGGEYRDPLGAAHARIAELEEKVSSLEAERAASKRIPAPGQFPELDTKVEGLRIRTNEKLNAQRRMWLTWIGIAFPIASGIFSMMHLPIYSAIASVIFIALILLNLRNQSRLKADKVLLAEAEKELADAHRIAELEAKLAETEQRVRVAEQAEAEPLSESESEPERQRLRS